MFKSLNYRHIFIISLILFIPAYFINLGLLPFIPDEGIRSLVALEMKLSNDFITPTLSGALYFKKPPLYNWVIHLFFEMSGTYNEFWMRVPAVASIFFFTLTIYFIVKKELGEKIAIITSIMFMTCGRLIIYESLHGLIDISYSWLTYMSFIIVYRFYKKDTILPLFIFVYLISAVTFLMKGLPTVVFTGITLFTFFIWKRKFKLLFNWKHFVGVGIFLIIVGGYYYLYFTKNQIQVTELFGTLFTESSRRTGVRFGIVKTVLNLFSFPFEMIYHFLPWTLFAVFLIRKDFTKKLKENDFVYFNALIFFFNILIYWFSVEVYARYLIMLVPLAFTVLVYFYENRTDSQMILHKILVDISFAVIMVVVFIAFIIASKFYPEILTVKFYYIKVIILSIAIISVFIIFIKRKELRIAIFLIFMFIFRLGFDWFVLPQRYQNTQDVHCREVAKNIGKMYQNEKLYTYWSPEVKPHPYYGKIITNYMFLFYLTASYQNIIEQTTEIENNAIYLVQDRHFDKNKFEIIDTIPSCRGYNQVYVTNPIKGKTN